MKKLVVDDKYNNKKLNTFLFDSIPTLTNNLFYKTLRKKDIKINGKRINKNVYVFKGDEILIYISDEILSPSINLDIFYEVTFLQNATPQTNDGFHWSDSIQTT